MQIQVATCNHTEVKGNILRSKSSIHDRNFRKFWRYFFHLIFVGSTFFFFQNTKSSSQIWIKKSYGESFCPHGNCFKKIIFEKLFSNIGFWQTTNEMASNKKKKASRRNTQEPTRSRQRSLRKSFTISLLIRCSEHSTKFPEKCPCKRWDLQQRHIRKLEVLSETIWEYYNAVSVSSCTFFRQYLFLWFLDSIILIS